MTNAKTKNVVPLMAALLIAVFAFQLNASMLSPALATMEKELHATSAQIGLTQTAFFTAAALFSLFLPRWGDLIGRRTVLIGMMAVTGLGGLVAALAPNVTVLFLGRVIQGVAGPTVPLCLIMLRQQVPNEKQYALLLGIITSGMVVSVASMRWPAAGSPGTSASARFSGSWPASASPRSSGHE